MCSRARVWAREPFLMKEGQGRRRHREREREISSVRRGEGEDEEAGVMRRRWDIYAAES